MGPLRLSLHAHLHRAMIQGGQFLHLFRLESGCGAILDPLSLRVVFGPVEALEARLCRGRPLPGECERILPTLPQSEAALRELQSRASSAGPVVMGCLFLHFDCMAGCLYCHLREGRGSRPPMTLEEAGSAVRHFAAASLESGCREADLLLFGGEPFMRPDLVRAVLRALPETPRLNLSISTCGYGVEPGIASELAGAGAFAIVSMDGPPGVHDRIRPIHGGSSSGIAAKAFGVLRDAGCRVGISVTVTEWNLPDLKPSFEYLMDRFAPDDIGLNGWLHPAPGRSAAPGQAGWRRTLEAVTGCLESALDRGIYVEQLFRRLRPFAASAPRLKDCTSAGGRLVYVPGGLVGQCDCLAAAGIGLVPVGSGLPSGPIDPGFSPVGRKGCLSCPALCICGGGCRYDAWCATGDAGGVLEDRCRFEVGLLEWMIERLHSICGKPALRGGFHVPSDEERSLLAGRAGSFPREAAPMPVATLYREGSS